MKRKLYISFLSLFLLLITSCSGIQWNKGFDDLGSGVYTQYIFQDGNGNSFEKNYLIGSKNSFPGYENKAMLEAFNRIGYSPDGWSFVSCGGSTQEPDTLIREDGKLSGFTVGYDSCVFKISSWKAEKVPYKVEIYLETVDCTGFEYYATEERTGETGTIPSFAYTQVDGFEPPATIGDQTIAGDGTSVFKLYYTRKICSITVYSDESLTKIWSLSGKYGTAVDYSSFTKPEKTGYVINMWYISENSDYLKIEPPVDYSVVITPELPETFLSTDVYLRPNWVKAAPASYTVHYMLENAEDTAYTEDSASAKVVEEYEYYKFTDEVKENFKITITHFTYKEMTVPEYVEPGNGTNVYVYYGRNKESVTVDLAGGSTSTSLLNALDGSGNKVYSGKYNSRIKIEKPVKTGYIFQYWKDGSGNQISEADLLCVEGLTITAHYEPVTNNEGSGTTTDPLDVTKNYTFEVSGATYAAEGDVYTVKLDDDLLFTSVDKDGNSVSCKNWKIIATYAGVDPVTVYSNAGEAIDVGIKISSGNNYYPGLYIFTVSAEYLGSPIVKEFKVQITE